jgi:methylenetetrahydrofolate reductase (NADPH)
VVNPAPARLAAEVTARRFVITTSVGTLARPDVDDLRRRLRLLSAVSPFVHFGDNPLARARVSPWAAAAVAIEEGLEPIVHVGCRDRNRLALKADLLGGLLLRVRNVLCLRGDEIDVSDDPAARAVRDTDVVELLRLAGEIGSGQLLLLAACDPNAGESESVFARLREKVEAGAALLECQPVFDLSRFARWLERLREAGVAAPVLADVFVLTRVEQAEFVRQIPFVQAPDDLPELLRSDADAGLGLAAEIVVGLRKLPGVAGCHLTPLGTDPSPVLEVARHLRSAS